MVSRSLLLELAIKRSTEALQHLVFRLKALALVSRWPAQVSFSIFLRLRNLLNQCLDHNRDGYGKSRSGSHESWSYHGRPNSPAYPSTLPTLETVLHDPLRTASLDTVPESSPTAALSEASSIEQISMVSISSQISNQNSVHDQNSMRTSLDKRGLVCVTPREYERYSRKKLPKVETDDFAISLPISAPLPQLPGHWTFCTHPEGAPYFYDESRRILTDFYLYDEEEYQCVETSISAIMDRLGDGCISWPQNHKIVLVLEPRKSGKVGYYFADHDKQVVLWPEDCDVSLDTKEVKVELKPSHIGLLVRSYYWRHNELFPHAHELSSALLEEISDILIHAVGDSLTSSVGLPPYPLDVLQNMHNLIREIENQQKTEHRTGSACFVYRMMATFVVAEQQFLNLHGERGARLSRDQSIYEPTKQTIFFKFLSPFLLFAPSAYLKKLQNTSVDSLVNQPSWANIKKQLTEEWSQSALFATVLLNANVAFLAIQSVDQEHRSNAQRASYFSVLTSMGAVTFGLLLTRQHQHIFNMEFLANRGVSALGFETLALMYSLPYVFLMWGTFSFLAAFSFMCYTSNDNRTYFLMSVAWFTLVLLLLWCISTSFETGAYFHPLPIRLWKYLGQKYQIWRASSSLQVDSLSPDPRRVEAGEQQGQDGGP